MYEANALKCLNLLIGTGEVIFCLDNIHHYALNTTYTYVSCIPDSFQSKGFSSKRLVDRATDDGRTKCVQCVQKRPRECRVVSVQLYSTPGQ